MITYPDILKPDLHKPQKQSSLKLYMLFVFSLSAYIAITYFTPRDHFIQFISLYAVLFTLYMLIYHNKPARYAPYLCVILAILLRCSLLLLEPNLSDDFYRFIWDGKAAIEGYNPYTILPHSFYHPGSPETGPFTDKLYQNMNSPHYYTVYPPVLQYIFEMAYLTGGDSILANLVVMRLLIIAGEAISLLLLLRLLKRFKLPTHYFILYAFNPLIIIELTGNLHFEALMITFLLATLWFFDKNQWLVSACCLGLASAIKLLPLMTLPYFIKRLGFARFLLFATLVSGTFLLTFILFLSPSLINNIFSSIGLYFQKFEFNGSIYYLLRWLGYQLTGINLIRQIGVLLAGLICIIIIISAISEKRKDTYNLVLMMLFAFTLYLLMSTTVHPWYISTLVMFSVFMPFRYPVVWSGMVMLSYAAYSHTPVEENFYLTGLEYLVVFGFIFYELFTVKLTR